MISLKKALCVLSFGLGLGFSMNSWAIRPDCGLCAAWKEECETTGNSLSCRRYEQLDCFMVLAYCPAP